MCRIMDELVEKGEKDGIVKGKISLLLTQLRSKFQTLPCDIVEKIERSSIEQLDYIGSKIFTINDENDIYQLLTA